MFFSPQRQNVVPTMFWCATMYTWRPQEIVLLVYFEKTVLLKFPNGPADSGMSQFVPCLCVMLRISSSKVPFPTTMARALLLCLFQGAVSEFLDCGEYAIATLVFVCFQPCRVDEWPFNGLFGNRVEADDANAECLEELEFRIPAPAPCLQRRSRRDKASNAWKHLLVDRASCPPG